jgi:hypothetical protein
VVGVQVLIVGELLKARDVRIHVPSESGDDGAHVGARERREPVRDVHVGGQVEPDEEPAGVGDHGIRRIRACDHRDEIGLGLIGESRDVSPFVGVERRALERQRRGVEVDLVRPGIREAGRSGELHERLNERRLHVRRREGGGVAEPVDRRREGGQQALRHRGVAEPLAVRKCGVARELVGDAIGVSRDGGRRRTLAMHGNLIGQRHARIIVAPRNDERHEDDAQPGDGPRDDLQDGRQAARSREAQAGPDRKEGDEGEEQHVAGAKRQRPRDRAHGTVDLGIEAV